MVIYHTKTSIESKISLFKDLSETEPLLMKWFYTKLRESVGTQRKEESTSDNYGIELPELSGNNPI